MGKEREGGREGGWVGDKTSRPNEFVPCDSHLVKIAQVISGSSCLLDGETKSKSAIEFRGKEIDD